MAGRRRRPASGTWASSRAACGCPSAPTARRWDHWLPAVLYDNPRYRPGLETLHRRRRRHPLLRRYPPDHRRPRRWARWRTATSAASPRPQLHWDHAPRLAQPAGAGGRGLPARAARSASPSPGTRGSASRSGAGKIGYPGAGAIPRVPPQARRARACATTRSPAQDARCPTRTRTTPTTCPARSSSTPQHFCNVVREVLRRLPLRDRPAGRGRGAVRRRAVRPLVVRGLAVPARCDPHASTAVQRCEAHDGRGGAVPPAAATR